MDYEDPAAEKAAAAQRTRRVLGGLGALLLLLPLLLIACPVFFAPLRNDLAADRLLKEVLADLRLPPEASVEETAAWAGNSSGTGNHVELWAGVLVQYGGPEENAPGQPAEDLRGWTSAAGFPRSVGPEELFSTLAERDSWNGYYILGTYGEAATQWDIRGH